MTTFRPDEYTLGAAIVTRLGETGTLALVICILAAITLGFLYILARGAGGTRPDVPPEVQGRIRDRVMGAVHEEEADE